MRSQIRLPTAAFVSVTSLAENGAWRPSGAVRASKKGSPWPPETTRLNRLIFPQMANWLPESERDQLRFEFEAELKRLNLAA
ncbi:MAG: hypothetical protein ACR65U_12695 [Methylocystis sp.]